MTLCVAWIRAIHDTRELVVASDSRLRFGRAWDACPKILSLGRSDAVLCFSGDTKYAYPFVLQLRSAVEMYQKAATRALDLGPLRGHLMRVMDHMLAQIFDLPRGERPEIPELDLLLAGFSWDAGDFKIWRIHFDSATKRFRYSSPPASATALRFMFIGDEVPEARRRLFALLRKKGRTQGLDMEPLEVVRDMIRDRHSPLVGGPPQIVKVYRHLNVMPYAVYWPSRQAGALTFLGRPLLGYESSSYMVLDPDTLDATSFPPFTPPDRRLTTA